MDLRTLFFVEASLLVLFGLTMIVNSIGQPWQKGTFYFAASNFSGAIGLVLHSNKPGVPRILTMVVANLFLFIELALLNKSIAEYVGRGRRMWIYLLAFSVTMDILSIEVILIHPNLPLRIDLISSVIAINAICTALLLLRNPAPGARAPTLVMGTLLLLYTTTNLIRIVQVWWLPGESFYHIWLDRTLVAGLSFGYLWMTAARLRLDLERQANTDALTGVLNRRALDQTTQSLFEAEAEGNHTTSAIMLDIDYFKNINDTFGHHAGDRALCAIADCLRQNIRPTDLIGRLGGDEFLVILPDTTHDQAQHVAQHLRTCFKTLRVTTDSTDTADFPISASIGVTSLNRLDLSLETIMRRGDRALYEAKAVSRYLQPRNPATTSNSATKQATSLPPATPFSA